MDSVGRVRAGTVQPGASDAAASSKPGPATNFQVEKVDKTEAPASAAPVSGPLAAFRAGALDRKGFVEAHIAQATSHLPAGDQERIRADLLERCETDPMLLRLIDQATQANKG